MAEVFDFRCKVGKKVVGFKTCGLIVIVFEVIAHYNSDKHSFTVPIMINTDVATLKLRNPRVISR